MPSVAAPHRGRKAVGDRRANVDVICRRRTSGSWRRANERVRALGTINQSVRRLSRMRIKIALLGGTIMALALVGQAAAGATPCSKRPYGEALLTPDAAGPAWLTAVRKASFVRAEVDHRPVPQVSPDGTAYFTFRPLSRR